MTTRSCLPEKLERSLQALAPGWDRDRERAVVDVILGEEIVHRLQISAVNRRIELADQSLVVVRHPYLPRRWIAHDRAPGEARSGTSRRTSAAMSGKRHATRRRCDRV